MKKILGRWQILGATLALSAAGFFLRKHHLQVGFHESGLPNGKGAGVLIAVCILAVLIFGAASFLKGKRPAFRENFSPDLAPVFLLIPAAALLAGGSVMEFMDVKGSGMSALLPRITAALGVASALCYIAIAAIWRRGKKPAAAAWLIPVLYLILQLIFRFKDWSTDPIILDYCFKLFGMLFLLLGSFYVGGFVFDEGKRRLSLFFCLGGVFFGCVSMADGGTAHVLTTAGPALYCLASAWHLARK